jgi:hypothetical protein
LRGRLTQRSRRGGGFRRPRNRSPQSSRSFRRQPSREADADRGDQDECLGHELDPAMRRRESEYRLREPHREPLVGGRARPPGASSALPTPTREGRQKTLAEEGERDLVHHDEPDCVERVCARQPGKMVPEEQRKSQNPHSHEERMDDVDRGAEDRSHVENRLQVWIRPGREICASGAEKPRGG